MISIYDHICHSLDSWPEDAIERCATFDISATACNAHVSAEIYVNADGVLYTEGPQEQYAAETTSMRIPNPGSEYKSVG